MDFPPYLPGLKLAATCLVCLPFIASGIEKLGDLPAAENEMRSLQLPVPKAVAIAVVALQLVGSAMIVGGVLAWLAALLLAAFTAAATLLGHRWWQLPADRRRDGRRVFLEHCAIVGGLLLVVYADLSSSRAAS